MTDVFHEDINLIALLDNLINSGNVRMFHFWMNLNFPSDFGNVPVQYILNLNNLASNKFLSILMVSLVNFGKASNTNGFS